jgi:hypothetical protein
MGKIIVAAAVSAGVLVLAHGALAQQKVPISPAQMSTTPQQGVDPYHMIGRYAAEAMAATEQAALVRQQATEIAKREADTKAWWAAWWKGMYPEPAPAKPAPSMQAPVPPK